MRVISISRSKAAVVWFRKSNRSVSKQSLQSEDSMLASESEFELNEIELEVLINIDELDLADPMPTEDPASELELESTSISIAWIIAS